MKKKYTDAVQKDLFEFPTEEPKRRIDAYTRKHEDRSLSGIVRELEIFKVTDLMDFAYALSGSRLRSTPRKNVILGDVADMIFFANQREFDTWFASLPEILKEAIHLGAFSDYVEIKPLEKKYKIILTKEVRNFGYLEKIELSSQFRLNIFFAVSRQYMYLPGFFRKHFSKWLPKPAGYTTESIDKPTGTVQWSNAGRISETVPLLLESVAAEITKADTYDLPRKGLLKKTIKKLRAACEWPGFPVASEFGQDPLDLFIRIIVSLDPSVPKRPADGELFIKKMTEALFGEDNKETRKIWWSDSSLEYYVLIDHLSRRQGYYLYNNSGPVQSRKTFYKVLTDVAKNEGWYDVQALYQSLVMQMKPFYFCALHEESAILSLKCDKVTIKDFTYSTDYSNQIPVAGFFHNEFLGLPLFRAYWYVMATFGIVEISEAEPPLRKETKGKKKPLSPYDGLCSVRVTALGKWCLGLSDERPEHEKIEFEAIADHDLLLVTFRGHSIERKMYLEQIGEKMGDERYRISEASFIRGCESPADIQTRITKFKKLIDSQPSPHWLEFFRSIMERAQMFSNFEAARIFSLPDDVVIRKLISTKPAIRRLILRSEGGRIVVREADIRKFFKVLAEYGFLSPEN